MWGFQKVPKGLIEGAWYHPKFMRHKPELCQMMNRANTKVTGSIKWREKSKSDHSSTTHQSINREMGTTSLLDEFCRCREDKTWTNSSYLTHAMRVSPAVILKNFRTAALSSSMSGLDFGSVSCQTNHDVSVPAELQSATWSTRYLFFNILLSYKLKCCCSSSPWHSWFLRWSQTRY
jgi:hypothetical protein